MFSLPLGHSLYEEAGENRDYRNHYLLETLERQGKEWKGGGDGRSGALGSDDYCHPPYFCFISNEHVLETIHGQE